MASDLIGRRWQWGVADCWSLARDWYQQERGIILPDWQRPETVEQFNAAPLFEELWAPTGFRELRPDEQLQPGDFLLFAVHAATSNHCGVLVDSVQLLHHPLGGLSRREPYQPPWTSWTRRRLRLA